MIPALALPGLVLPATQQSILDPRGPAALRLANLGGTVLLGFAIVSALMIVLVVWAALRRRGTLERHEDPQAGGGQTWIWVGGIAIPAVILAAVFVAALRVMDSFPIRMGRRPAASLVVTGHQWWWEVEYLGPGLPNRVTTANEIHIPTGEPVDIELRTADVIHSFWVPQLHGKVDLEPGQVNRIRIQADQPGRYRGQCAEYCGAQHAHMVLWITADPPAQYAAWLQNEAQDAAAPRDSDAVHGSQVFADNACALCHTVRGTLAGGRVGPDLTHIGSRPTIAAGSFPNDRAHLTAWVVHAQSLKPGSQMPDVAAFDGPQLNALVTYLQGLR